VHRCGEENRKAHIAVVECGSLDTPEAAAACFRPNGFRDGKVESNVYTVPYRFCLAMRGPSPDLFVRFDAPAAG
jgi:hypothetical protein